MKTATWANPTKFTEELKHHSLCSCHPGYFLKVFKPHCCPGRRQTHVLHFCYVFREKKKNLHVNCGAEYRQNNKRCYNMKSRAIPYYIELGEL